MDVMRFASLFHDADDRKLFGDNGYANVHHFMDFQGIPTDVRERVVGIMSQISFKSTDSVVPNTFEGGGGSFRTQTGWTPSARSA